jgi:hypothetical protein
MHVTTINYFVQGAPTLPCCPYPVIPDPSIPSGEIEVVDCAGVIRHAVGLVAMVNPDGSCPCGTVPVQKTTWGRAKAMYVPHTVSGPR